MTVLLIVAAVLGPPLGFAAGVLARPGVLRAIRLLLASVRRTRSEGATASWAFISDALADKRAREARRQRGLP